MPNVMPNQAGDPMQTLDLNADLGESFGAWSMGDDRSLLSVVTSANIACGFHAGDPSVMARTVDLALEAGVALGAHPGYPDLQGFGRRAMALTPQEAQDALLYQIGALEAFLRVRGARLNHVKPHGALYNAAAVDARLAEALVRAVKAFDPGLILVGLAGSELTKAAEAAGLQVAHEAFADRAVEADGTLTPRGLPGAMLTDTALIVARAVAMVTTGRVQARCGTEIPLRADTLCLHGDGPHAVAFARALQAGLAAQGWSLASLRREVR